MGYGLKQENMSSIAPMALAHPSIPLEAGRQNTNEIETQPANISTGFDQYQTTLWGEQTKITWKLAIARWSSHL